MDRVTDTLDVLKNLYDTYNAKLKQIQSREKELQELKVPLAKVNLQALLLEEEHEKNKGAIEARREAEQAQEESEAEETVYARALEKARVDLAKSQGEEQESA